MQEKINKYIKDINSLHISSIEDTKIFHTKYLSKKGLLNQLFNEFKNLSVDQKREQGPLLNKLKKIIIDLSAGQLNHFSKAV